MTILTDTMAKQVAGRYLLCYNIATARVAVSVLLAVSVAAASHCLVGGAAIVRRRSCSGPSEGLEFVAVPLRLFEERSPHGPFRNGVTLQCELHGRRTFQRSQSASGLSRYAAAAGKDAATLTRLCENDTPVERLFRAGGATGKGGRDRNAGPDALSVRVYSCVVSSLRQSVLALDTGPLWGGRRINSVA